MFAFFINAIKSDKKNKIRVVKSQSFEYQCECNQFIFSLCIKFIKWTIVCGASKSRHTFIFHTEIHWQSVEPAEKLPFYIADET